MFCYNSTRYIITAAGKATQAQQIKMMIDSHGGADSCLPWPYKLNQHGYGVCRYFGRDWRVHRVAYILAHGELPNDICVLHKCDNPPCFNPKHLFLGTRTDNLLDMRSKGRGSHGINPNPPRGIPRPDLWGEKNKNSKLTGEKVAEIKIRLGLGHSQQSIANEFRVNQTLISAIKRGATWKHI